MYKMIQLALEKAHDIRKFEIELYWKRSAYFFVFFTVITAMFAYLFTSQYLGFLSPVVSAIGTLLSICLYYANIGSKYWQCNWESIIDKLEFYITGNLYKIYFFDSTSENRPSVSYINQFISRIILFLWIICFIVSTYIWIDINSILFYIYTCTYLIVSLYTWCICNKYVFEVISEENKNERFYRFRKPKHSKHSQ
ncbi:hypothetical protein EGK65_02600 [Citrobacter farmeri]|nr:hypothetical protein EGK65_02600 [Citrobacter farmeri]